MLRRPRSCLARRATRGQALIELALTLPFVVGFALLMFSIWVSGSRSLAYEQAARTLAELISRNGAYTATMQAAIIAQLEGALGVGAGTACISITVSDASGTLLATVGGDDDTGLPVPSSATATTACTVDNGQNEADLLSDLPNGGTVRVDVWSAYELIPPADLFPGVHTWQLLDGHQAMVILHA